MKRSLVVVGLSIAIGCAAVGPDYEQPKVEAPRDLNGTIDEFRYPRGKFIETLSQPQSSSPQSVATTPDLYP